MPFLILHGVRLWSQPHYQYFPFVLAASAAFLFVRWPQMSSGGSNNRLAVLLLGMGLPGLFAGTLFFSPYIAIIGSILSFGAAICYFAGKEARQLVSAWALLWFTIPLPMQLDSIVIRVLQRMTSQAASYVLDLLAVEHILLGNVLETPGRQYLVEEACSGMQSLFSLLAFTAIYAVWQHRPLIPTLLLLISAVAWAGLMNIVRVSFVVVADVRFALDLTDGLPHALFGLLVFGFALLMLLSTDRLIDLLLHPVEYPDPNPLVQFWNWLVRFPDHQRWNAGRHNNPGLMPSVRRGVFHSSLVACVFLVVGVLQTMQVLASGELFNSHQAVVLALTEDSLPNESGNWQVQEFETIERTKGNTAGRFSRVWTYGKGKQSLLFSVDFPFIGWKELCECYLVTGWELKSRRIVNDVQPPFVEVEIANADGESRLLLYSSADAHGRPLEPPASVTMFQHQFGTKIRTGLSSFGMDFSSFEVQLMVPTTNLSQAERQEIQQTFCRLRERVYSMVARRASE